MKKSICIFLVVTLLFVIMPWITPLKASAYSDGKFTVCAWNLNPGTSSSSVSSRIANIGALLKTNGINLVGVQYVNNSDYAATLSNLTNASALPSYQYNQASSTPLQGNAILYDLTLMGTAESFALPNANNYETRRLQKLVLRLPNGSLLSLYNTHLDHHVDEALLRSQMEAIATRMASDINPYKVLTGCFNTPSSVSHLWTIFTSKGFTTANGTNATNIVVSENIRIMSTSRPNSPINATSAVNPLFATLQFRYTVTFTDWNGRVLKTQTINHGESAMPPTPDPARPGYTFSGWSASYANVTEDRTVMAQYTPINYNTVYLNLKGASNEGNPNRYTIEDTVNLGNPGNIAGYTFSHWSLNNENVAQVKSFGPGQTGDITLYTNWLPNYNRISYENLNGASNTGNPIYYTIEDRITLNEPGEREGYEFTGWRIGSASGELISSIEPGQSEGITLFASWELIYYTVTFIWSDNQEQVSVPHGGNAKPPDDPLLEGQIFRGWYPSYTNVTRDLIITPVYDIELHTVTFEGWAGIVIKEDLVPHGSDAEPPAAPPIRGYDFIGWLPGYTNITGNITVAAQYMIIEYSITYVTDGVSSNNPGKYTVEDTIHLDAPENMVGYTFSHWSLGNRYGERVDAIGPDWIGNITLFANRTPIPYSINYLNLNYTSNINPSEYTIEDDFMLATPGERPDNGFTFSHWTLNDASGDVVTRIRFDRPENIMLFANWTPKEYKVTFTAYADTQVPDPVDVLFGSQVPRPIPDPVRIGYDFTGWSIGNTLWDFEENTMPAFDFTLDADWTPVNYNISYVDLNDSNNEANPTYYTVENTIILANLADTVGYTFLGWSLSDASGEFVAQIGPNWSEDITLFANWRRNKVTITWDPNGGSLAIQSSVLTVGDTYGELPAPIWGTERERLFAGWFTAKGDAGAEITSDSIFDASATTYYAKWTVEITLDGGYNDAFLNSRTKKITKTIGTTLGDLRDQEINNSAPDERTFMGWTLYVGGQGIAIPSNTPVPDKNTLYYAKWVFIPRTGNDNQTVFTASDIPVKNDELKQEDMLIQDAELPLASVWNNPYVDVNETHWFYDSISFVAELELMNGTSSDRFMPNLPVTRAMMVTILYRFASRPTVMGSITFSDIQSGQWYTDAVIWAAENGIVNGYSNGKFGWNDLVTREQLVTILHRYVEGISQDTSILADLSQFADTKDIADWGLKAMQWAVAKELVQGRTAMELAPKGNASRAEVAAIFMRFIEDCMNSGE